MHWNGKLRQEKLNRSDVLCTACTDHEIFCQFSKSNVPKTLYLKVAGISNISCQPTNVWQSTHRGCKSIYGLGGENRFICRLKFNEHNIDEACHVRPYTFFCNHNNNSTVLRIDEYCELETMEKANGSMVRETAHSWTLLSDFRSTSTASTHSSRQRRSSPPYLLLSIRPFQSRRSWTLSIYQDVGVWWSWQGFLAKSSLRTFPRQGPCWQYSLATRKLVI